MFTNHKFCVGLGLGLHVTFGLNDRCCILIQYPSWSVKGFGETIELLIAWSVKLLDNGVLLFLTHCASWPTWSTLQTQAQI